MSDPRWYKSRLKSWSKPKIVKREHPCPGCGVPMTITPTGLVCYYCKMHEEG